jgi:hypothetical protein
MHWLAGQQDDIEAKLARRHLAPEPNPARMALFDLSSSWLEGTRCPLAARGCSRDGKKGRLQIEWSGGRRTPGRGLGAGCRGFEVPVQQLIDYVRRLGRNNRGRRGLLIKDPSSAESARSTRRFCRACGHRWLPGVEEGDDGQDALVGVQGGVDFELAEDAVDVLFHRTLRYPQGLGDPGVGLTLGHQLQHLSFS